MSKLLDRLYLLSTVGMLPLFTQCQVVNNTVEPDPVQIQETRLMYYDDYIYLRDNRYRIYEHEPKEVTISRCGDEFSIKGIFKKYPDAWIKGKIMPETDPAHWGPYITKNVYFENGQIIAHENGKPVYFHCGTARYSSIPRPESVTMRFTFKPEDSIRIFRFGDNPNYDGTFYNENSNYNAFWYDNDPDGETVFYSTWQDRTVKGTGFPDFDCVVNFRMKNQRKDEASSTSETY